MSCRDGESSAACGALPGCSWENLYEGLLASGWRYTTCEREADGRPNKLCTALCENQMFCGGLGLDPYAECKSDALRLGSSKIRKCEDTRPTASSQAAARECRYIATGSNSGYCETDTTAPNFYCNECLGWCRTSIQRCLESALFFPTVESCRPACPSTDPAVCAEFTPTELDLSRCSPSWYTDSGCSTLPDCEASCEASDCLRDDTVCGRCNALCSGDVETGELCQARCANSLACGGPALNATLSCEAEHLRDGATLEERCDDSFTSGATQVKCRSNAADGTCGNEDYCLACIEQCSKPQCESGSCDFSVEDCIERCESNPVCCERGGGSCPDPMGSCEAFKVRLGEFYDRAGFDDDADLLSQGGDYPRGSSACLPACLSVSLSAPIVVDRGRQKKFGEH